MNILHINGLPETLPDIDISEKLIHFTGIVQAATRLLEIFPEIRKSHVPVSQLEKQLGTVVKGLQQRLSSTSGSAGILIFEISFNMVNEKNEKPLGDYDTAMRFYFKKSVINPMV